MIEILLISVCSRWIEQRRKNFPRSKLPSSTVDICDASDRRFHLVGAERTNKLGESQGAARDSCQATGIGRVQVRRTYHICFRRKRNFVWSRAALQGLMASIVAMEEIDRTVDDAIGGMQSARDGKRIHLSTKESLSQLRLARSHIIYIFIPTVGILQSTRHSPKTDVSTGEAPVQRYQVRTIDHRAMCDLLNWIIWIRRDKSYVLQCIRFLAENRFLEDIGKAPLIFPSHQDASDTNPGH